ncbi:MAG: helix-turn-helix domain-containing protein [Bacteroidia bacterium]
MNITFHHILLMVGASQGFLLSLFLGLKQNRWLNFPLIVFLFLTSADLLFQYLYANKAILHYPHLIYISEPFNALCGTLIYLYLRNVCDGNFVRKKYDILLFLPFFAYLGYYLDFYLQPAAEKIEDLLAFYETNLSDAENLKEWCFELAATLPFLYASLLLLKKQQFPAKIGKGIRDNYRTAQLLLWVMILLYFFEAITILLAFRGSPIAETSNSIAYLLSASTMYLIGYDALVRETVLQHTPNIALTSSISPIDEEDLTIAAEEMQTEQTETPKYKKNALTPEKIHEITAKIIKAMEEDKLYRNPNFRISDLAVATQENPNNLSQVMNDVFKQNFFDLVNTYRIEEAKLLLKSPNYKNYTISAIGFEVGFNAKSTFYAAFKKNTTLTPVQYQNV